MSEITRILFYDGACGICSQSVRFLMHIDRSNRLFFAPLQGTTAAQHLPAQLRKKTDLSTIVYLRVNVDKRERFTRTTAIAEALIDVEHAWKPLGKGLRALPKSPMDGLYKILAKNRHKILKKNSCPFPSQTQRAHLLP